MGNHYNMAVWMLLHFWVKFRGSLNVSSSWRSTSGKPQWYSTGVSCMESSLQQSSPNDYVGIEYFFCSSMHFKNYFVLLCLTLIWCPAVFILAAGFLWFYCVLFSSLFIMRRGGVCFVFNLYICHPEIPSYWGF